MNNPRNIPFISPTAQLNVHVHFAHTPAPSAPVNISLLSRPMPGCLSHHRTPRTSHEPTPVTNWWYITHNLRAQIRQGNCKNGGVIYLCWGRRGLKNKIKPLEFVSQVSENSLLFSFSSIYRLETCLWGWAFPQLHGFSLLHFVSYYVHSYGHLKWEVGFNKTNIVRNKNRISPPGLYITGAEGWKI